MFTSIVTLLKASNSGEKLLHLNEQLIIFFAAEFILHCMKWLFQLLSAHVNVYVF